jgi:hypothetical protein
MKFAFLGWRLAIRMQAGQALIACIGQNTGLFCHDEAAVFEQLKVMLVSKTEVHSQDLFGVQVCNPLCFLGVPLLFAAVVPFLSFTISKIVSLGCNAFLPGK